MLVPNRRFLAHLAPHMHAPRMAAGALLLALYVDVVVVLRRVVVVHFLGVAPGLGLLKRAEHQLGVCVALLVLVAGHEKAHPIRSNRETGGGICVKGVQGY